MGTHRAIALGKLGGSKRTKLVIVTSNRNIVPSANRAYEKLAAHAITQQMEVKQGQQWMDWAQWMSAKYQRTSSAVEGRNGYLSPTSPCRARVEPTKLEGTHHHPQFRPQAS